MSFFPSFFSKVIKISQLSNHFSLQSLIIGSRSRRPASVRHTVVQSRCSRDNWDVGDEDDAVSLFTDLPGQRSSTFRLYTPFRLLAEIYVLVSGIYVLAGRYRAKHILIATYNCCYYIVLLGNKGPTFLLTRNLCCRFMSSFMRCKRHSGQTMKNVVVWILT